MIRKYPITEERKLLINEIAQIMGKRNGPITRKELAKELEANYPISYKELMNNISGAIQDDRRNNRLFQSAGGAKWELANK